MSASAIALIVCSRLDLPSQFKARDGEKVYTDGSSYLDKEMGQLHARFAILNSNRASCSGSHLKSL